MLAVRWSLALLSLLGATPAFSGPPTSSNFQGRIRANDAPLGGRFTIAAFFLDSLDVGVPRPGTGRWLLLRFHDSNGKDAFVVPTDLAISGLHRTSYRMEVLPVGRSRVGGQLNKDENRWALWWVPQGDRLDWNTPDDINLKYGFSNTNFVPVSDDDLARTLKLIPWSGLKRAASDTTQSTDRDAVDAAAFDQPPVPKVRRDPQYPSSAKMYDFHGSLFIAAHVNSTGQVEDAYVLQSDAVHDLNVAALAAVMDWVFKPGMKSGKPVAGDIVIPIKFDLGSVK